MTSGPGLRRDADADAHEADADAHEADAAAHSARAVRLLLFASAREAAGIREVELPAATVGEVIDLARARFGPDFSSVLDRSRVWLNGEPVPLETGLSEGDEVAVLPPVSGG